MAWERKRWRSNEHVVCSLALDASKQAGWEYMCGRMDEVSIPAGLSLQERLKFDLSTTFRTSICPVGTLGYGETDVARKARYMEHIGLMSAGTQGMDKFRTAVRGYVSDQGCERNLSDTRTLDGSDDFLQALTDPQRAAELAKCNQAELYQFPQCLSCLGPLHVQWNAYEAAIKGTPFWQEYEPLLRAVLKVVGDSHIRDRLEEKAGFTQLLKSNILRCKRRVVDWKWGYMDDFSSFVPDHL